MKRNIRSILISLVIKVRKLKKAANYIEVKNKLKTGK